MDIGSILATTNPATTGGATQRLADDFDTFLMLLTTQLKHQDPLSPMNSTEFTQQLVSFAGVEQAIATNENLEDMLTLLQVNQVSGALGYLGNIVTAKGNIAGLSDGFAQWNYSLPRAAASVAIQIKNAEGDIVFSGQTATTAGPHSFRWNGLDNQGVPQPEGFYTITLFPRDPEGVPIDVTTTIDGFVSGIENVNGKIVLTVNGMKIALEDITAVWTPPPAPPAEPSA